MRRGDEGTGAAGKTNQSKAQASVKGRGHQTRQANDIIPSHQLLGTTLCLNQQLTQRRDESMTKIRDNLPITVKEHFLGSFDKKVIWAAGFEISNINFTRPVSGSLHLDLGLHRIWGWGKLGREHVYDRTGHTRPAFHFWGDSALIVHINDDFLSFSLSKSHWLEIRER